MRFVVDPRRLFVWLVTVVVAVNVVSLVARLLALQWDVPSEKPADGEPIEHKGFSIVLRLMNVGSEANIPTWVNEALLLMSALALWGVTLASRRAGERWWRHWAALGLAFAYLSLDELASLHEKTMPYVAAVVEPRGFFTFGWVLLAGPAVVLFALAFSRFLHWLPARTSRLMVLSGVLYVTGALVFEMVSGYFADTRGTADTLSYVLSTSVEELLEMLGVSMFVYAVASYARETPSVVGVPAQQPPVVAAV